MTKNQVRFGKEQVHWLAELHHLTKLKHLLREKTNCNSNHRYWAFHKKKKKFQSLNLAMGIDMSGLREWRTILENTWSKFLVFSFLLSSCLLLWLESYLAASVPMQTCLFQEKKIEFLSERDPKNISRKKVFTTLLIMKDGFKYQHRINLKLHYWKLKEKRNAVIHGIN